MLIDRALNLFNQFPTLLFQVLVDQIRKMMKRLHIPNGLEAVGFTKADIPELVKGTLPQHRVTKLSPRPVGEPELAMLFVRKFWIQ